MKTPIYHEPESFAGGWAPSEMQRLKEYFEGEGLPAPHRGERRWLHMINGLIAKVIGERDALKRRLEMSKAE